MTDAQLDAYTTYVDEMGNTYHLVPFEYVKNSPACMGCAFKFGNSSACRKAKTCTPKFDNGESVLKGRQVWVMIW